MKTIVFSFILIIGWIGLSHAQNIIHVPDTAFLSALIEEGVDTDGDGLLSYEEAQVITELDVSSKGITDMTRIKVFKNLTSLDCSNNEFDSLYCSNMHLTSLNVANNLALTKFYCETNQLSSLDVSTCTSLEEFHCGNNQLSSIDITNNISLVKFGCVNNHLISLDVSKNINLLEIWCNSNQITNLDISNNKALWLLDCSGNKLDSLDLSAMMPNSEPGQYFGKILIFAKSMLTLTKVSFGNLYYLNEGSEEEFRRIDGNGIMEISTWGSPNVEFSDLIIPIPDTNFLYALIDNGTDSNGDSLINNSEAILVRNLNVSSRNITDMTGIKAFSNLETLDCSNNLITDLDIPDKRLTTLDVSNNDSLNSLNCYSNQLSDLDVSNCTALILLNCSNNQLTSLNLTNCSALVYLNCTNNQLSTLQLATDGLMEELYCETNQLSSIDVLNCSFLNRLYVSENQLSELDITHNDSLQYCSCKNNQLALLDISNNLDLIVLDCSNNLLDSLDISNNHALGYLACGGNKLTALDVSNMNYYDCWWGCHGSVYANDMPTLSQIDLGNSFYRSDAWGSSLNFTHLEDQFILIIDTTGSPNIHFLGEVVYIPDTIFLHALIEEGIDLNGDSLISCSEAKAVYSLCVSSSGISDLTGIEAFANLDTLDCSNNDIINLDFLPETTMEVLNCSNNLLSNLDLSNSTGFQYLNCSQNRNLNMICVSALPVTFEFDTTDCPNAYFSNECGENIVYIPDQNFLDAIVKDNGVDNNGDGQISYKEAHTIHSLDVNNKNISVMRGIEAFKNLEVLHCWTNNISELDLTNNRLLKELRCPRNILTDLDVSECTELEYLICETNHILKLDVSNCPALTSLNCAWNQLKDLDVSKNTLLEGLDCTWNKLTNLDITQNTLLSSLSCPKNLLTSLDVSNNPLIEEIWCNDNLLTKLDLRNNRSIWWLNCSSNPNLEEICVWEVPVPFEHSISGCPKAFFTTDCNGSTKVERFKQSRCTIYPNPTNHLITIETETSDNCNIDIVSLNGQLILSQEFEGAIHRIDLSSLQKGIYFITVGSTDYVWTEKIIKL